MNYQTTIDPEVLDVLRRSSVQDRVLTLPRGQQLPRELYLKVAKVLEAKSGKWKRQNGGFMFSIGEPSEILASLVSSESFDDSRKMGFFPTPRNIVWQMIQTVGLLETDRVLEPSAGVGSILIELPEEVRRRATAVELDEDRCTQLDLIDLERVVCGDFMSVEPLLRGKFDVVLMNPPFAKNQDIKHIVAAYGCLKSGGRLAAIMSPHALFAEDKESVMFRSWVYRLRSKVNLIDLPDNTFREAGTNVKTKLLSVDK